MHNVLCISAIFKSTTIGVTTTAWGVITTSEDKAAIGDNVELIDRVPLHDEQPDNQNEAARRGTRNPMTEAPTTKRQPRNAKNRFCAIATPHRYNVEQHLPNAVHRGAGSQIRPNLNQVSSRLTGKHGRQCHLSGMARKGERRTRALFQPSDHCNSIGLAG